LWLLALMPLSASLLSLPLAASRCLSLSASLCLPLHPSASLSLSPGNDEKRSNANEWRRGREVQMMEIKTRVAGVAWCNAMGNND
jgi:hypothetical protein